MMCPNSAFSNDFSSAAFNGAMDAQAVQTTAANNFNFVAGDLGLSITPGYRCWYQQLSGEAVPTTMAHRNPDD